MVKKVISKSPTSKKTRPWWRSDLMIGALSMLLILLAFEALFSVPSSWFTREPIHKIDIDRPGTDNDMDTSAVERCTREYRPVCGADGQTYSNACMANTANTIVVHDGACTESATGDTQSVPTEMTPENTGSISINPEITEGADSNVPITTNEDYTDAKKFHIYENSRVGYGMAFPAYSYYQGYGAQDGSVHSMALGLTEQDIADFSNAPVRVWFYKTVPATPPSTQSVTLESGTLYVAHSSDDPKIRKIAQDILASAK